MVWRVSTGTTFSFILPSCYLYSALELIFQPYEVGILVGARQMSGYDLNVKRDYLLLLLLLTSLLVSPKLLHNITSSFCRKLRWVYRMSRQSKCNPTYISKYFTADRLKETTASSLSSLCYL